MTGASPVVSILSALFAAVGGFFGAKAVLARREAARRRAAAQRLAGKSSGGANTTMFCAQGVSATVLGYLLGLEQRLSHGSTPMLTAIASKGGGARRDEKEKDLKYAGLSGAVGLGAIREGRVRLALLATSILALVGACLSNELAVLFGVFGLVVGQGLPFWAVKQEAAARTELCRKEMPEMLEVVVLGLSSGMSFDRSFGLYHAYFDCPFAQDCASAQQKWELGFSSREEALRELAEAYDLPLLKRVVENVVRSMRFGTSLVKELEKAVEDGQADLRTSRQEKIAKAPIKMMIPTATLILPAMLLLVLGPVLLELVEGF